MSENHYRLDLTERERTEMMLMIEHQRSLCDDAEDYDVLGELLAKLRALEPIGTGGTTEGNG